MVFCVTMVSIDIMKNTSRKKMMSIIGMIISRGFLSSLRLLMRMPYFSERQAR